MNNSYVKFNLNKVEENIKLLLRKCKGIDFIFPVKCCSNKKFLKILSKYNIGFDISNLNEYNIIKKYKKNRIMCGSGVLNYQLCNFNNIIAFSNSINFLADKNSIRINFNDNDKFNESHFGIAISQLNNVELDNIVNVHFHNSDYKNKETIENILIEIEKLIKMFPNLKLLDIGGHLEDLQMEDAIKYLNNVRKIVPKNIRIIVETGDLLFKGSGTLYSKVVDSYIYKDKQNVFLNFSKLSGLRWSHPTLSKEYIGKIKTYFYGLSCCEDDVFCISESVEYKRGEKVIFENISPYSYEWNNIFNGINKMKYIWEYKKESDK